MLGNTGCPDLGDAESNAVDSQLAELLSLWPHLTGPERERLVEIVRVIAEAGKNHATRHKAAGGGIQ